MGVSRNKTRGRVFMGACWKKKWRRIPRLRSPETVTEREGGEGVRLVCQHRVFKQGQ
ncbi:hypothetical protein Hanom_Chr00s000603g01652101 [Helianthus anomalus]